MSTETFVIGQSARIKSPLDRPTQQLRKKSPLDNPFDNRISHLDRFIQMIKIYLYDFKFCLLQLGSWFFMDKRLKYTSNLIIINKIALFED